MPASCCAVGCRNRHGSGSPKKFFRFPKLDLERRQKWVQAIGRDNWEPNDGTRICSDHFADGQKSDHKDSPNYVPTLFNRSCTRKKRGRRRISERMKNEATTDESTVASSSGVTKIGNSDSESSFNSLYIEPETLLFCSEGNENSDYDDGLALEKLYSLQKRRKKVPKERPKRIRKARYDADYVELDDLFCSDDEDTDSAPEIREILTKPSTTSEQSTQTILEHTYIRNLEEECYNLRCELSRIKGKYMFKDMELEMFENNDEKVRYLTGLESYDMLKALSDILSEYQRDLVRLSSFQQLMITLMKIKLNLPMKFFSVLFNVNLTGVSRLFNETIDLLFKKMVPLYIVWPSREDMKKVLPPELGDCQNCVYIADTFELQVDLSSGPSSTYNKVDGVNNQDLYSPNKGQTVKRYLMTIAPQGSVIFISKGVAGEVSDRTLALESGFFENITPGDVILTEKELGIDDAVAVMGANLRSSNSVKSSGKSFMHQGEEDSSKRLARIRRVIQLLKKKYVILGNKIPINWVKDSEKSTHTTLDKIVHIVCALSNMTNKVWSYEKYLKPKSFVTVSKLSEAVGDIANIC